MASMAASVGSIGGIADKDAADRFAAKSYSYPSLNGVGSAAAREVEVYNFSTDSTPDWQEFKYIETVEDFRKIDETTFSPKISILAATIIVP